MEEINVEEEAKISGYGWNEKSRFILNSIDAF